MDLGKIVSGDIKLAKLRERYDKARAAVADQESRIREEQSQLKGLRDRERRAREKFGSALLFALYGSDVLDIDPPDDPVPIGGGHAGDSDAASSCGPDFSEPSPRGEDATQPERHHDISG